MPTFCRSRRRSFWKTTEVACVMNLTYCKAVGTIIRSQRIKQSLSQEQLAAKVQLQGCDLTRSALAKIECGQRSIYPDELKAVKQALNVPYEALLP